MGIPLAEFGLALKGGWPRGYDEFGGRWFRLGERGVKRLQRERSITFMAPWVAHWSLLFGILVLVPLLGGDRRTLPVHA